MVPWSCGDLMELRRCLGALHDLAVSWMRANGIFCVLGLALGFLVLGSK